MKFNSLGQGEFLQISVWRPSPWQSLPPIWGVGELQRRIRVMTPSPQVTEQEDQGDQWLQPPSCLTVSNTYRINSPCSEIENISYYNGCVKNAEWLTAFVTFLGVAVTGLNRGALTVVVDAVAGASALLDATTTSCRTRGPFRPGGPTILFIGRCRGGRHKVWTFEYRKSDKNQIQVLQRCSRFKKKLTATRAALSIGHGGVSTGHQRAGDFATHGSRVLDRGTVELVQEE